MEEVGTPLGRSFPSDGPRPVATHRDQNSPVSAPLSAPSGFEAALALSGEVCSRLPFNGGPAQQHVLELCVRLTRYGLSVDLDPCPTLEPFRPARGRVVSVYVVRPTGTNEVKIGITTKLDRRIRALQHANGRQLETLVTFEGGRGEEAFLHAAFQQERLHGEWFSLTPRLADWIDRQKKHCTPRRRTRRGTSHASGRGGAV